MLTDIKGRTAMLMDKQYKLSNASDELLSTHPYSSWIMVKVCSETTEDSHSSKLYARVFNL